MKEWILKFEMAREGRVMSFSVSKPCLKPFSAGGRGDKFGTSEERRFFFVQKKCFFENTGK